MPVAYSGRSHRTAAARRPPRGHDSDSDHGNSCADFGSEAQLRPPSPSHWNTGSDPRGPEVMTDSESGAEAVTVTVAAESRDRGTVTPAEAVH